MAAFFVRKIRFARLQFVLMARELPVDNGGMAMFHPEVAEVFVVTKEGSHEFLPENVQLLAKVAR